MVHRSTQLVVITGRCSSQSLTHAHTHHGTPLTRPSLNLIDRTHFVYHSPSYITQQAHYLCHNILTMYCCAYIYFAYSAIRTPQATAHSGPHSNLVCTRSTLHGSTWSHTHTSIPTVYDLHIGIVPIVRMHVNRVKISSIIQSRLFISPGLSPRILTMYVSVDLCTSVYMRRERTAKCSTIFSYYIFVYAIYSKKRLCILHICADEAET